MIGEWIRFAIVALLFLAGIVLLFLSVLGTYRFDFAMNRIHAAGINDTMVLMLFMLALGIWSGFNSTTLKFVVLLGLQWFTSPITSHMLAKLEYLADDRLSVHCDMKAAAKEED